MNSEIKTDYGILMAKKAERLVTALYLVTDLIIDSEPIKQSLRKNAISLLASMNALSQIDIKDRLIELKMSLRVVTEIISMLNVSIVSGIISEMNGGILIDGFRALQVVLEKRLPVFTKDMLDIEEEDALNINTNSVSAITSTSYDAVTKSKTFKHGGENVFDVHKGHLLKTDDIKNEEHKRHHHVEDVNFDKHKEILQHHQVHNIRETHTSDTSFQLRKHNRKDQILALFVRGVDINIKDISSRIRGCSEKTIQRELNSLVSEGKINRIGEKRWSRYILR